MASSPLDRGYPPFLDTHAATRIGEYFGSPGDSGRHRDTPGSPMAPAYAARNFRPKAVPQPGPVEPKLYPACLKGVTGLTDGLHARGAAGGGRRATG